ncbi:ABC transporter permease [Azospirillum sp. ST 5-10]|uniref:ABC transporter permease n=1 Tax=unclassified Azospirillum TaxID=2630922 RepID=UPI003F4A037F
MSLDRLLPPVIALAAAMVLFGLFVAAVGVDPLTTYALMYKGAFGSWFSWQNTLTRAAPLVLTALCTALPAQLGLVVIGGEGALVLGGLAAVATALALDGLPAPLVWGAMGLAGMATGAALIGLAGALRHARGVNETISSLLLTYIAVAVLNHMVEGPMRDPASLNKPSTPPIPDPYLIGAMPGMDVHWGLALGVLFAVAAWVLMARTTFGFAARMVGGNPRAARMAGLPVGVLLVVTCALGGAAAGLAGVVEVAAVHGRANAAMVAGYGFTGILVAFLARQNPLAVIPVAVLFGGIGASGGLLQRRLDLPDAAVLVLQGIIFVTLLASESLQGRLSLPRPAVAARRAQEA